MSRSMLRWFGTSRSTRIFLPASLRSKIKKRRGTGIVVLFVVAALSLPALALATQFFSGTLQAGQFTDSSGGAVSDQTQKNSGSGCALTYFNIVGSNVYPTCGNTTFTVSAQEATGHTPANNPACGAMYASVNVTCRYFNGFKGMGSATAVDQPVSSAAAPDGASVDPSSVNRGTTADGVAIFYARHSDGALCAGFGQAVLCPGAGDTSLFADSPIVAVTVSKLIGNTKSGGPILGTTQRVIGFVRADVVSIAITTPSSQSAEAAVLDHAFEYDGPVTSVRATDASGRTVGTTTFEGGS